MEAGLAAMYGNGEGQNTTHYYAGRPDTKPKCKGKTMSCKTKKKPTPKKK